MKHTKKALFFRLLWYIIMILVSLVFCFPVLYLIFTGFKTPQETVAFPPTLIPKKWTLSAYEEGLSSGIFSKYLLNSIFVSGMVVIGTVSSAALVGFGFARLRSRMKNFLFMLVLATMMIPSSVTLIPVYSIYSKIGWIDTYLPLIVPAFTGGGAFSIFLIKQFFLKLTVQDGLLFFGKCFFQTQSLFFW